MKVVRGSTLLFSSAVIAIASGVAAVTVWFLLSRHSTSTVRSLSLVDSVHRCVYLRS